MVVLSKLKEMFIELRVGGGWGGKGFNQPCKEQINHLIQLGPQQLCAEIFKHKIFVFSLS